MAVLVLFSLKFGKWTSCGTELYGNQTRAQILRKYGLSQYKVICRSVLGEKVLCKAWAPARTECRKQENIAFFRKRVHPFSLQGTQAVFRQTAIAKNIISKTEIREKYCLQNGHQNGNRTRKFKFHWYNVLASDIYINLLHNPCI